MSSRLSTVHRIMVNIKLINIGEYEVDQFMALRDAMHSAKVMHTGLLAGYCVIQGDVNQLRDFLEYSFVPYQTKLGTML